MCTYTYSLTYREKYTTVSFREHENQSSDILIRSAFIYTSKILHLFLLDSNVPTKK